MGTNCHIGRTDCKGGNCRECRLENLRFLKEHPEAVQEALTAYKQSRETGQQNAAEVSQAG